MRKLKIELLLNT